MSVFVCEGGVDLVGEETGKPYKTRDLLLYIDFNDLWIHLSLVSSYSVESKEIKTEDFL